MWHDEKLAEITNVEKKASYLYQVVPSKTAEGPIRWIGQLIWGACPIKNSNFCKSGQTTENGAQMHELQKPPEP